MEHYLFLSNDDSVQPGNTPGDFIVTLPKRYRLEGHWECALLEISLYLPYHQRLHVCCDVIQDSYLKGTLFPLLRTVPAIQADGTRLGSDTVYAHLTFEHPYFISLRKKELDRLRLFIRGSDMQSLALDKPLHCVLLLKKRKWVP